MTEFKSNREPRKRIKMGTYYDIVAGALYFVLAYFLYSNPPQGLSMDIVQIFTYVFGFYGVFRVGRGIYRITRK